MSGGSVLFLSSNAPIDPGPSTALAIERNPEDMALLGIRAPEDVVASLALDDAGVRELAAGATPNRDGTTASRADRPAWAETPCARTASTR